MLRRSWEIAAAVSICLSARCIHGEVLTCGALAVSMHNTDLPGATKISEPNLGS
ncbi:hypothetical protein HDU97_008031, partial [Phlyctochytrium planicorne]